MPYYITREHDHCKGWAVVTADGTLLGCHRVKYQAVDQMVAVSVSEGLEPAGELPAEVLKGLIGKRGFIRKHGVVLKHLKGEHDQKSHGSWATGRTVTAEGLMGLGYERVFSAGGGEYIWDANNREWVTREEWERQPQELKDRAAMLVADDGPAGGQARALLKAQVAAELVSRVYRDEALVDSGGGRMLSLDDALMSGIMTGWNSNPTTALLKADISGLVKKDEVVLAATDVIGGTDSTSGRVIGFVARASGREGEAARTISGDVDVLVMSGTTGKVSRLPKDHPVLASTDGRGVRVARTATQQFVDTRPTLARQADGTLIVGYKGHTVRAVDAGAGLRGLARGDIMRQYVHSWAMSSNKVWTSVAMQIIANEMYAGGKGVLSGPSDVVERARGLVNNGGVRRVVSAMYENTQSLLKAVGVSSVVAFRGIKPPDDDAYFYNEQRKTSITAYDVGNPLSAWSTNGTIAQNFAGTYGAIGVTRLRAADVFATPLTGIGCANESEIVALADKTKERGTVWLPTDLWVSYFGHGSGPKVFPVDELVMASPRVRDLRESLTTEDEGVAIRDFWKRWPTTPVHRDIKEIFNQAVAEALDTPRGVVS